MSISTDNSTATATSLFAGGTRTLATAAVTLPLDTLKVHSQTTGEPIAIAAKKLWQTSPREFYRGAQLYLSRKGLTQLLAWPIILQGENVLQTLGFDTVQHPYFTEVIKANAIVSMSALCGAAELERKRIEKIQAVTTSSQAKVTTLQALPAFMLKGSVNWSTFLVGQRLFSSLYRQVTAKKDLHLGDQALIATGNTLLVATAGAIPDRWQTLRVTARATLAQACKTPNRQAAILNGANLWLNNLLSITWIDYFTPKA